MATASSHSPLCSFLTSSPALRSACLSLNCLPKARTTSSPGWLTTRSPLKLALRAEPRALFRTEPAGTCPPPDCPDFCLHSVCQEMINTKLSPGLSWCDRKTGPSAELPRHSRLTAQRLRCNPVKSWLPECGMFGVPPPPPRKPPAEAARAKRGASWRPGT
jgi:hypothetical protein